MLTNTNAMLCLHLLICAALITKLYCSFICLFFVICLSLSILLILCFILYRRHRIHRKAAVISWKLQNHRGNHLVGLHVVLYSDPPNIINCSTRRIYLLLSLFTYVHFVEQKRCVAKLFASHALGLAVVLLDNETFIVTKGSEVTCMNASFAEGNPQRRKY